MTGSSVAAPSRKRIELNEYGPMCSLATLCAENAAPQMTAASVSMITPAAVFFFAASAGDAIIPSWSMRDTIRHFPA